MNQLSEYDYAKSLNIKGCLPGPELYNCGAKLFSIQNYSYNKVHGCYFKCSNTTFRKAFPILQIHYLIIFGIIL